MTVARILLVEDDPDQLQALNLIISSMFPDAAILAVPDGYNALTQALSFQPDAIISDVAMPQADGLSFLHALLPQLPQAPKMLVLTSYDRKQLQRFGPMPEQALFLQKPARVDNLQRVLADWF
jgi:two-component system, response regulator YesN